ncbi:MAG: pyruvate, phosphate dikinase [Deltaproteobacteria bacterium]|jgi:pyruvate,orthophosphate dikinase|nr:pyruvate, phosphate dikinase [Deltaproteobacteria bacterium]
MASKLVYSFGGPVTDGHGGLRNLLGGKGANLAEMAKIGLPVPAGFTITTEVCTAFYKNGKQFPPKLAREVSTALNRVEKIMKARFGSPENPLLVSCRSGARVSMPGMMDTVLNIGLNDRTAEALIAKTKNPRFVYDSYRRFVAMYGDVVMGVKAPSEQDPDPFDTIIDGIKQKNGYKNDTELTTDDLISLVAAFKSLIARTLDRPFPEDPEEQLWGAIGAVFDSWMIDRAKEYRRINQIPESWGTAVNVQAMVFGNMGENSATGVAFSRDPSTGENYFYGEYLINAQGEDVVAGVRTPNPINRTKPLTAGSDSTLADDMPEVYKELDSIRLTLENHYRDMQDIEFTIQEGKLWMLQCRNGKRTAQAALKIALDLVQEKRITTDEAILRVDPEQISQLLHPSFDHTAPAYKKRHIIATGLPASPGAATGKAVFSATDAEKQAAEGLKVILVRLETSPEDIRGMNAAQGILTARGGMTSHAAVVARGMGRTCVAGASDISIDYGCGHFTTKKGDVISVGDWISLDGATGEIIKGSLPTKKAEISGNFSIFMDLVEKAKRMKVRTNADTPHDSTVARQYGAEGIGLCRTEHMFFESDRIDHVRAMILADTQEQREKALSSLRPMQREDFYQIFKAMDGLPVTIRTLDPPLHEFLPHTEREINELAKKFNLSAQAIKDRITALKEQNPMLGLRGCRLGIVHPEITAMQARAIFEAAVRAKIDGMKVFPEIMIPLVGHEKEFILQKQIIDLMAQEVFTSYNTNVDYLVGTMIELPRAALIADRIVKAGAEFFSFGTNDMTQTTFGLSRDDSGTFLPDYLKKQIWDKDPFVSIDQDSVGEILEIGITRGRSADKNLKIGICGEHGGDPSSVVFCYKLNMDYVSCSPPRVPVARLAAAQEAIREKMAKAELKTIGRGTETAATKKAAVKTKVKKTAAKTMAKPAAKKATLTIPIRKTVIKPTAKKTAAKMVVIKPLAKKTAAKTAAPKMAAKSAAQKTAAKRPIRKTVMKTAVNKTAAKPALKKTASKSGAKKIASKSGAKK